jgi:DNA repair protein RecN (Recombination protein N)
MLRFLRIARLAVIDAVEVEFEPGFNVLTGETGAGKSILVEAVGLLLGGRASGDLVRTGEDAATVEAIFQRGDHEIVIRRELTAQGRSRAFIDGTLVTAGALKEHAAGLIELHGQHEHETLLDPATHLTALDAFAALDDRVRRASDAYDRWHAATAEIVSQRADVGGRAARQELAAFQLREIEAAALESGEDERLTATRQVLTNAARVERLCAESYAALYDADGAALSTLGAVWKRVGDLAALDPSFAPYLEARDGIRAQLEELATFLRRYADGLDVSPARLQQTEDRLALIERLKRKYGPTLAGVIERREALAQELDAFETGDERLRALEHQLASLRDQFLAEARSLSDARRQAAPRFVARLLELLAGLALERTRFEIRFNDAPMAEHEWSALGIDRAEFLISPNPGEELRPLARIASGGELSRVMLALKTMTFTARLADADGKIGARRVPGIGAPGMIFDEVDAGIGGRVADAVGRRLRGLGSAFQVLCITHLPQVAACADAHFAIEKRVERDRTLTRVTRLTPEGRVEELARMLAGNAVSPAVRASAREMLQRGAEAKGELKSKGESETSRAKGQRSRGA